MCGKVQKKRMVRTAVSAIYVQNVRDCILLGPSLLRSWIKKRAHGKKRAVDLPPSPPCTRGHSLPLLRFRLARLFGRAGRQERTRALFATWYLVSYSQNLMCRTLTGINIPDRYPVLNFIISTIFYPAPSPPSVACSSCHWHGGACFLTRPFMDDRTREAAASDRASEPSERTERVTLGTRHPSLPPEIPEGSRKVSGREWRLGR